MSVTSNYHQPGRFARHAGARAAVPQFAGPPQSQQTDEQSVEVVRKKRGWMKTLLLGMGAIAGLCLFRRVAMNVAGKAVASKAGGKTAQKMVSSAPGLVASLVSTGGGWVFSALRSEIGIGLLVAGAQAISLRSPAFKVVTDKVTKENLQKLLNPDLAQNLLHEISEHKLHSPQAIKEYISKNTDSIAEQVASLTGFSEQGVRETLHSLRDTFGSTAA